MERHCQLLFFKYLKLICLFVTLFERRMTNPKQRENSNYNIKTNITSFDLLVSDAHNLDRLHYFSTKNDFSKNVLLLLT